MASFTDIFFFFKRPFFVSWGLVDASFAKFCWSFVVLLVRMSFLMTFKVDLEIMTFLLVGSSSNHCVTDTTKYSNITWQYHDTHTISLYRIFMKTRDTAKHEIGAITIILIASYHHSTLHIHVDRFLIGSGWYFNLEIPCAWRRNQNVGVLAIFKDKIGSVWKCDCACIVNTNTLCEISIVSARLSGLLDTRMPFARMPYSSIEAEVHATCALTNWIKRF